MAIEHDTQSQPAAKQPGPWGFAPRFLATLLAGALGVLLGVVIVYGVAIPRIGLAVSGGRADRILNTYNAIPASGFDGPTAVCLGNSISIEGIDADQIESQANGWRVYNFAMNGCHLDEMRAILPRILDADPEVIIVSLPAMSMGDVPPMEADLASAYAISGFLDAWDHRPRLSDFVGQDEASIQRLNESGVLPWLSFRTSILGYINAQTRARLRSGILPPKTDDFVSPFQMVSSLSGKVLDRHLMDTVNATNDRLDGGNREGAEMIGRLTELAAARGVRVMLVAAPQHPMNKDHIGPATLEFHQLLEAMAGAEAVAFVNATDLLEAEDFADALHPNERGRAKFSAFLGQRLARWRGAEAGAEQQEHAQ